MNIKTVVITGSTRGLGLGVAAAFLGLGHQVVVGGRSVEASMATAEQLKGANPQGGVLAKACDVRDPAQVQALWDAAREHFGRVDVWINNAGFTGAPMQTWMLPPAEVKAVVETNLLGVMYGSAAAVRGMLEQGAGAIYNMEGMGSDGRKHEGLTYYGTTKYGLHYYNECLASELQGTPVISGILRPGMVVTDLVTGPYKDRPEEWQRVKKIFNIIADTVENVAPWLAGRMLENRNNGAVLSYSSPLKIMGRFITSPFSKRDLFAGQ